MESLADQVRRRDPDRFFCTLFAPAARRETLFTLYAFNNELARAQEVAREPALALIRLQWWHEVVEGAEKRHLVATPLRAAIAQGALPQAPLLQMIETREADCDAAPATCDLFIDRLRRGPGALAQAAGYALGATDTEQARLLDLGAAYGAAGTWRNIGARATQHRNLLPPDLLAAAGLAPDAPLSAHAPSAAAMHSILADIVRRLLGPRQHARRSVIAAMLPAALARRDMAEPRLVMARGLGDRAAVLRAALTTLI